MLQDKNTTIYCPRSLKYLSYLSDKLPLPKEANIRQVSSGQGLRLGIDLIHIFATSLFLDIFQSKKVDLEPAVWISYNNCAETRRLEHIDENQLLIGAAISLSEVKEAFEKHPKKDLLQDLIWYINEHSSPHVRNVGVS